MDFYSLLSIFLFLVILVLTLLIFFFKNKKLNLNLPPSPTGLPVLGNFHQLGALPHITLWQWSKKYGPVMLLRLGRTPTVVISSAEAAKEVLKTHDLSTCTRPLLTGPVRLSYNSLDIAYTQYGDYYREMRKICVLELFGTKRVQSLQFIIDQEVALMIDSINTYSSSSSPVDLGKGLMDLTANITSRIAFSKTFCEREIRGRSFMEIAHEAEAMLASLFAADFFPYVGWIVDRFTGLHAKLEQIFHELDSFYQQVIDDHLQATKAEHEHEDIVDVLLKFVHNKNESSALQFTQDHVKALLMNIFLGGVNTAASTLLWAMAELSRNPRAMRKAQEEIRSFVRETGKVSENDINHFGYLILVIKETLRLHPPIALLIPRETKSEININGYHIPPKTRIEINIWAIARDSETWENPLEFMPERFIDSPVAFNGQNYEYLPFGSGRRICPGISLGIAITQLALANLLYCFDWKLPDGMKAEDIDMEESFGLLAKKTPLLLIPVQYGPASAN